MGRTWIRQDAQIRRSVNFVDNNGTGTGMQTSAVSAEDDLNNLRSQVNRILDVSIAGKWYDDIATKTGLDGNVKRGIKQLQDHLDQLETRRVLCRTTLLTDIAVGAGVNYKILSVATSQAPTQAAAVGGSSTYMGAVVAASAFSGAGFSAHELVECGGQTAINPKNLCIVRDSTTGQIIQSSGRDVFALLQSESGVADGDAFNDTSGGKRVKLSFVRQNSALDDLEAVPTADIENKTVNYAYVHRHSFDTVLEDCFLPFGGFVDQSASVDVTRQRAYDNQGTTPVELSTNADLDLAATKEWTVRDATDADLLRVIEGSTGGTTKVQIHADVDTFDVDAAANDFAEGVKVDSAGNPINLGVTPGQIDSAVALTIKTTAAVDLGLESGGELNLTDKYRAGSSWAQAEGVPLAESSAEWSAYETAFGGEKSLLAAITAAMSSGGLSRSKVVAVVTTAAAANANVGGPATANNVDADFANYTDATNMVLYNDLYLNGQLLRPGSGAGANHDYYEGSTAVQFKFEFGLEASPGNPDVLTQILWVNN